MRKLYAGVCAFGLALILIAATGFGAASTQETAPERRVVVFPFERLSPDAAVWIAPAVQKDLLAEVANLPGMTAVPQATPAGSSEQALSAVEKSGADFALFGSYQMIDQQLRFTARLVDAQGKMVGSIQATGALRELFALEDDLGNQLRKLLKGPSIPHVATTQPAAPPAVVPSGPVQRGDYGPYGIYGPYEGSSLQRAVQSGNLGVPPPQGLAGENDRSYWYRYGMPYQPWGWGYYYFYFPTVRWHVLPRIEQTPPQTPFVRPGNLPPSNVQGYFPVTLQPPRP